MAELIHPQEEHNPNQGNLQQMPMGSLLLWILREQFQGELHIEAEGYRQWLYFSRGFPVASRGGPPENFLGWVLREKGLIDDDVYLRSLQKMAEQRKPQGQILLEMGSLRPEQLQQTLQLQLQRKIIRLFRVDEGTFFLYPTSTVAIQDITPGVLDPYTLLSNGTRQEYTELRLQQFLTHYRGSMIKRKTDHMSERFLEKLGLDEVEKAALQLLNGWTTVDKFVASEYLDRYPSLLLLAQLIMADLLFVEAYSQEAIAKDKARKKAAEAAVSTDGISNTVEASIDDDFDLLAALPEDHNPPSAFVSVSVSMETAIDPRKVQESETRPRRRAHVQLNVKEDRIETIEAPTIHPNTDPYPSTQPKRQEVSPQPQAIPSDTPWHQDSPPTPLWNFDAEEAELLLDSLEEMPAQTDTMMELPASDNQDVTAQHVYPQFTPLPAVPMTSDPEVSPQAHTAPPPAIPQAQPRRPSMTPPPPSVLAPPPPSGSMEPTPLPPLQGHTMTPPPMSRSVMTPPPSSSAPNTQGPSIINMPPPPAYPGATGRSTTTSQTSGTQTPPPISQSQPAPAIITPPPPSTPREEIPRPRNTPPQPAHVIAPPPPPSMGVLVMPPPTSGSQNSPVPGTNRPVATSGTVLTPPPPSRPSPSVPITAGPITASRVETNTAPRPTLNPSSRVERVLPPSAERNTSAPTTATAGASRPGTPGKASPVMATGSAPAPRPNPAPAAPAANASRPSPAAPSRTTAPSASDSALSDDDKKHEQQIQKKRREIESGCSHYDLLMVSRFATANEIRDAYYKLSRTFHPDRVAGTPLAHLREDLEMIFSHLNEAYSTLNNKSMRSEYDEALRDPEAAKAKERAPMAAQAEIHYTKALVFLKQRNFKAAEEETRWAVQLLEDEGDYQAALAWAIYNNTEREKVEKARLARHHIELAAQHNADPEKLHFYWGMIEKNEEQYEEALKHLNESLRHNPRNVDATREMRHIKVVLRQDRDPKPEEEKPKKSGWGFFKK